MALSPAPAVMTVPASRLRVWEAICCLLRDRSRSLACEAGLRGWLARPRVPRELSHADGTAVTSLVLSRRHGRIPARSYPARHVATTERGLGAVGDLELVQDAGHVILDGLEGQPERAGDLRVARPAGEQL